MAFAFFANANAQKTVWPEIKTEMKPGARWWWLGSAVDKENLKLNLEKYAEAGLGSLEITPIYGVQGNDANNIPFLSPRWMEMLMHTESQADRLGIRIDMNTGTGWPFGGPDVSIEDAASKLLIEEYNLQGGKKLKETIRVKDEKQRLSAKLSKVMAFSDKGKCLDISDKVKNEVLDWKAPAGNWRIIAVFCGKTFQKVKRAAPGGEGYVMNHLSAKSVENYLSKFEKAFDNSKASYPNNFFNDSYEVYGADWTEDFFEQFEKRRGYKLENYLPEFLASERDDTTARIISDYRETIGELLLENFSNQWTAWAHKHGSKTRNQAHGSPGNLIDIYAAVDIPECEGFGLSAFGIRGLRKDSLTRRNDSDFSMLKYASSAAHISGKLYTSSETFTWLTEHFRTSLSQCKPDMDLMFVSGVNHMYFHGTTYSPLNDPWPGWKFYASIDMSPTNSIWRDAPAFFQYITRCQSFLQAGNPDNDFLLYLPFYDLLYEQDGRLLLFDIHKMEKRAPRFIEAVHRIYDLGYDMDYISDKFVRGLTCPDNSLMTASGQKYKALLVPGARLMPDDVLEKLFRLAEEGATIVFLENYPEDVPGFASLEKRRMDFHKILNANKTKTQRKGKVLLGTDYAATIAQTGVEPESMRTGTGLSFIRRSNENGHHYFISALKSENTEAWIPLAVQAKSAVFFDPMTGKIGKAKTRVNHGKTEVFLQLASGESLILKTFANEDVACETWTYYSPAGESFEPTDWQDFYFVESFPEVPGKFEMKTPLPWTELAVPEAKINMGTGRYSFHLPLETAIPDSIDWMLDLGDVRESARVRINGEEIATLWAVPYRCPIAKYLKKGNNLIEIDVTNLPANRISELDRQNIPWRKFKEINLVDLNYKATGYGHWETMPSGLLGNVKIFPVRIN